MKTFRQIIEANHGEPLEISTIEESGLKVTASCWTDDPEVMDWPASFDVSADWEITCHSPVSDAAICYLHDLIVAEVGGDWCYDPADLAFKQVMD